MELVTDKTKLHHLHNNNYKYINNGSSHPYKTYICQVSIKQIIYQS
jgi:hypothetical protein